MQSSQTPVVKDLVLVGGGHSHVTVLKRFGMKPLPGVRLTVICRDVHTPYSGMLPGYIAGHYTYDDAHIDLGPLSRFAEARFYHDEVIGLDLHDQTIQCRNRPDVHYDLLSINIGSTPGFTHVPGADKFVVPVKPINNFVQRWERLVKRVLDSPHRARIGVVGAGAGGIELTLAIQFRLKQLLLEAGQTTHEPDYHIFSNSGTILPTHNRWVQNKFKRVLSKRGVQLHTGCRVVDVHENELRSEDGSSYPLDEILWVTDAIAPNWIGGSGLTVDDKGFVRVKDALQSISHPNVFAAGDIAAVDNHPREKAGVFAVRQGKPLENNLRRALLGQETIPFTPQSKFLSLISTGDQYAVASRGHFYMAGSTVWKLKDWIDRRFMDKYNVLPEMAQAAGPEVAQGLAGEQAIKEISALAMRCGGCGEVPGAAAEQQARQERGARRARSHRSLALRPALRQGLSALPGATPGDSPRRRLTRPARP